MASTLSAKAERYLAALKTALSAGRHHEIPELSRKVRKHSTASTCFARSAEVQSLLLQRLAKYSKMIDESNFNDSKGQFYWLNAPESVLVQEQVLLDEASSHIKSSSPEDVEFTKAVKLFFLVVSRQIDQALQLAMTTDVRPQNQMSLQTLALAGLAEELHKRPQDALLYYQKASDPSLSSSGPANSIWTEHYLYRQAILSPSQATYEAYMTFSKAHNSPITKTLHVMSTRPNVEEYHQNLFRATQFPSAETTNLRLLNHVSSMVDPWLVTGKDAGKAEELLDMLFEAAGKTFHSPRILRYIFYTLSVLERFEEALLSLRAYLQIAIHAQKTQLTGDRDSFGQIVETVYYAVSVTLAKCPSKMEAYIQADRISQIVSKTSKEVELDNLCKATINAIIAKASMLRFQASADQSALDRAIEHFRKTIDNGPTSNHWLDLSLAFVQKGELALALSAIRESLQINSKNGRALMCFANLLCCEELFDRALLALQQVRGMSISSTAPFDKREEYFSANFMHIKILEKSDGPAAAMNAVPDLLTLFSNLFGSNEKPKTNGTNGASLPSTISESPPQIPSIQIADVTTASIPNESPPLSSATNSYHGSFVRLPTERPDTLQTKTIRSASLKLTHPNLQIPHHLNLRKSASTRSFQMRRQPGPGNSLTASSRSSSPMIHTSTPTTINSTTSFPLIPDIPLEQPTLDRQPSSNDLQRSHKNRILASVWLYIAHLSSLTSNTNDAHAAIEEAKILIGTTPAIILAQLDTTQRAMNDSVMVKAQIEHILTNYEIALSLDDSDVETVLAFADFLLISSASSSGLVLPGSEHDGIEIRARARAYEMVETVKESGRGQIDPRVWSLSSRIAFLRGEEERGERELWKVVELSDTTGIRPWIDI